MCEPFPTCNPQSVCCEVWCRQQRVYRPFIRDPLKVFFFTAIVSSISLFFINYFSFCNFFTRSDFPMNSGSKKKIRKSALASKSSQLISIRHLLGRFLRENFCAIVIVRIRNHNHFYKNAVFMFAEPTDNYWRDSSDGWGPSYWSRCCSPKPAITLATSEYHRPFVPSLVPNHPRSLRISPIKAELQDMSDLPSKYLIQLLQLT